jgi:hypothetical protein
VARRSWRERWAVPRAPTSRTDLPTRSARPDRRDRSCRVPLLRPLDRRDMDCRPGCPPCPCPLLQRRFRNGWTDVSHVRDEVGVDFRSCSCFGQRVILYSALAREANLPCGAARTRDFPSSFFKLRRGCMLDGVARERRGRWVPMCDGVRTTRRVLCCRIRRGADTSRASGRRRCRTGGRQEYRHETRLAQP